MTAGVVVTASLTVMMSGCFEEDRKVKQEPEKTVATEASGGLFDVAKSRGLKEEDLAAALKTFVPTGARDAYVGMLTGGTSGRLVVFGMPSMRVLKIVGIFTPEPWQGFGYDDESRALLESSAREDVEYGFGESGLPALSETAGVYDGVALFAADAAHGRVGVMHLDDFETKQVVTNPFFLTSHPDVAVTPGTEYVIQTTAAPELPASEWAPVNAALAARLRGGVTFWRFQRGETPSSNRIEAKGSFAVELPPYVQGESDSGKGTSSGWVFTIGACRGKGVVPGVDETCGTASVPSVLHVINLEAAQKLAASTASRDVTDDVARVSLARAVQGQALGQVALPPGPTSLSIAPDGQRALVTFGFGTSITVLDLAQLKSVDWSSAPPDDFGVPTLPAGALGAQNIEVGGPTADAAFSKAGHAYVSVVEPGRLVRLDLARRAISTHLDLGFSGGRLLIPGGDSAAPTGAYAVVMNTQPHGRFVSVGPVTGLNPHLVDISETKLVSLYDMSVPQASGLAGVAMPAPEDAALIRYALGTDTRSGALSPFRTIPGQERVERKGNRVHVFGTLIRSHLTPEIVEVDEGDEVTFHLTNLEQAQDQTHGFTVGTYNVHGSWEPGKVASVTFVADQPGVFPYYCTEFCSALHLEMMGYLLVKPKGYKATAEDSAEKPSFDPAKMKEAYEAKMKVITETQAVIDSVVKWLTDNKYERDPRAAALVKDAVAQLEQTKEIKPKIDAAVAAAEWQQALLWAEQYFQYQVKCADAGLRAKKILSESEAQ
ncbi:MAG: cytochrome C [Deltaproteobacteria bacterium]|nr:cytochrome C [Deltaproteobacteria bacterium]